MQMNKLFLFKQITNDFWILFCGTITLVITFMILAQELNTKHAFNKRYEETLLFADNCFIGLKSTVPSEVLSDIDTSSLSLIPTVLPYRRAGSAAYNITQARFQDVVRGYCNLDASGLDTSKEIFVHWGTFLGEAIFDVNGKTIASGEYSARAQAIVTIPRGWTQNVLKIGFKARNLEKKSRSLPGPASLLPIFATQDINKIGKIDSSVKSDLMFGQVFRMGTYAAVLIVLLTMLGMGANYPDIRWMTLSLVTSYLSVFLEYNSHWSQKTVIYLREGLFDFSICTLSIALFSFARGVRFKIFPKICLFAFVLVEGMFFGLNLKLGWRYPQASMFVLLSTAGLLVYLEGLLHKETRSIQKKIIGLTAFSFATLNIPAEAFARETGVFYSDFILQLLSWGIGGVIAVDTVRNLARSKFLKSLAKDEVERRISLETKIKSELHHYHAVSVQVQEVVQDNILVGFSQTNNSVMTSNWILHSKLKDETYLMAFGDVYGKDIASAHTASFLTGMGRGLLSENLTYDEFFEKFSSAMHQGFKNEPVSTGVFLHFGKQGHVKLNNCSHPSVFVLKDMVVDTIRSDNPPLGVAENSFKVGTDFVLFGSDVLVLVASTFAKGAVVNQKISEYLGTLSCNTHAQELADLVLRWLRQCDPYGDHTVLCLKRK
jgi:hypothetical protein